MTAFASKDAYWDFAKLVQTECRWIFDGPAQYVVMNRRRVRRLYGLDIFVVEEDAADYAALVRLFQRVRLQPD